MKVSRRPKVLDAWPPRNAAGKKTYQRTLSQYADILYTIRENGGEIEDPSGLLATRIVDMLAEPSVLDSGKTAAVEKYNGLRHAVTQRLNELADMELVDVYRRGKRTYRVVERFDGPYPFTNPHQSKRRAEETNRRAEEQAEHDAQAAEQARLEGEAAQAREQQRQQAPAPTAADVGVGVSATEQLVREIAGTNGTDEVGPVVTVDNRMVIDYGAMAMVLLDEVVRRATTIPDDLADTPAYVYVERNHLAEMNTRLTERNRQLEHELQLRAGRIKTLELELAEGRRMYERMERNIETMAETIDQIERRLGDNLSADSRREIERIMQQAPGFVREYRNARRAEVNPSSRDLPEGVTVGAPR